jgi:hypothetical protein
VDALLDALFAERLLAQSRLSARTDPRQMSKLGQHAASLRQHLQRRAHELVERRLPSDWRLTGA